MISTRVSRQYKPLPPSPLARWFALALCIGCSIYGLSILRDSSGLVEDYAGFMTIGAAEAVLPAALGTICVHRYQIGSFEAVRMPRERTVTRNTALIAKVAICSAAIAVFALAIIDADDVGAQPLMALSLLGIAFAQLVMMTVSVGIALMALHAMGIQWMLLTALAIAFYVLVDWIFLPLGGEWGYVFCYFWYPISPSWTVVCCRQIVPFAVFSAIAFALARAIEIRRDRLES